MIREAIISDLDAITEIENSSFLSDHFTIHQFRYLITKAKSEFLVYQNSEDHVVGYIIGLLRKNCCHLRIYSVAVHNDYKGNGIARMLFAELENVAIKKNFSDLILEVRENREDLISIYEKFGYQKFGVHKHYYADGAGAVRMRKVIK